MSPHAIGIEPDSSSPSATGRTLEQWLDPSSPAKAPPELGTRLREIADARALRAGMWAAFLSIGLSAVFLTFVVFALTGIPRILPAAIVGALVALIALLALRRERFRIPRSGVILSARGPGIARAGLVAAAGIFLVVNAVLVSMVLLSGNFRSVLVIDVPLLLLLVSVLVVPSAVIGRARISLRRAASRHPRLTAALEQERLGWSPTAATGRFGPL
ncbi:hypothetical protein [Microbacterium sp.]|uniref:hypothetical protein n=1 Tax=Microbacterium sp. TaxID=51671 RepID=UPI002810EE52|nr:hypothetical protein [Microbacterium sp.]